jgi:hypothetical protein
MDGGGARRALRERKSAGGSRGGRNKIAPRQVERDACRILSVRFRISLFWHLSILISRRERKVLAV